MKQISKRRFLLAAVALFALPTLVAGCVGKESPVASGPPPGVSPSGNKAKGVIGVSLLTSTNPFFNDMGKAIQEEAAANGMQAVITSADHDPAKQKDQINDFIVKKVSAIILNPADSKSVGTAIKAANDAGIPVFTADIASLSKDAKVVSHIATDNLSGGRMAAEAMIEALGGKGKIAILDYPEAESVMLRTQGFEEVIKKHNAEGKGTIEIVVKLQGGGEKDKSFKATQDILQAHADLNGIFAINDPSALGAISALETAQKLSQIKIVGFDGQPEGKQAIKDGKIYADPIQFPDQIGKETVKAIVKFMAGDKIEPQLLIPTKLYKKADADADKTLAPK